MNKKYVFIILGVSIFLIIPLIVGIILIQSKQDNQQTTTETVTERSDIPFEKIVEEDYNLFTDSTDIPAIQTGITGTLVETYEVTKNASGEEIERKLVSSENSPEKQDKITRVGMLDRETETEKVKALAEEYLVGLQTSNFDTIYPYLTTKERMLYTKEQLESSALAIGYRISSFEFNSEVDFILPSYASRIISSSYQGDGSNAENTDEINYLRAEITTSIEFESPIIGKQGINDLKILLDFENGDWKVHYIGPTEVIPLNVSKSREDGGKTWGEVVGAEISINNLILFPYLDRMYFDYELTNTSTRNFEDDGTTFIPTDAYISNIVLYDEPSTVYSLNENALFMQGPDVVWVGETAVGRLMFTPNPGPKINKVFLTIQLTITDADKYSAIEEEKEREEKTVSFVSDIEFGEIEVVRQNKAEDLDIGDEEVVSAPVDTMDEASQE